MSKEKLPSLFNEGEIPEKFSNEWQGMPEFIQEDQTPTQQIIVSFQNQEDVKKFSELIGIKLTYKTKSIWYPELNRIKPSSLIYSQENES
jgi:hypothetical protein